MKNIPCLRFFTLFLFLMAISGRSFSQQGGITKIYTDYNGYWTSSTAANSTVKPQNDHNVLGFTWNNITYSTGANDGKLKVEGISFTPVSFQAFPVRNVKLSGTSSMIAYGQLKDGVHNGRPATVPFSLPPDISVFLTDGIRGLNIGTGVANVPASLPLTFDFGGITDASKINDGVPDILVSQIAAPDRVLDQVYFIDANGNRVGNIISIDQTLVQSVGNWTADFYEPNGTLGTKFTNTDRQIRLWAADVSAFGITASNYAKITALTYKLNGTSDPGFLAFNTDIIQLVTANADHASTNIATAVDINVLNNDVPLDAINSGSVTIVTAPKHGTFEIKSPGVITYTPATGFYGTDSLVYRISNLAGTQSDEGRLTIEVGYEVATPVFNAGLTSLRCTGAGTDSYIAAAANAVAVNYSLNPAAAGTIDSSTGTVSWAASFSGNAVITATAIGTKGPKSANFNVVVNALPEPVLINTAGATTFCEGGNISLSSSAASGNQWFRDGISIDGATGKEYLAALPGSYTVSVTNGSGCSVGSAPLVLTTVAMPAVPAISASGPVSFCEGGNVVLQSSAAEGNQWFKDGSPLAGATAGTYTASESGTYAVAASNNLGCSILSAAVMVSVNAVPAAPQVKTTGITTAYEGENVKLVSSETSGNQWFRNGLLITGAVDPVFYASEPGDYSLVVTNASGCGSAVSGAVTVNFMPLPPLTALVYSQQNASVNGAADGNITIHANGGKGPYLYKIGSGDFQSADIFGGLKAGTYTFTVKDSKGTLAVVTATITEPAPVIIPPPVNKPPTIDPIADLRFYTAPGLHVKDLTNITPGPETEQTVTISVSTDKPGLFDELLISGGQLKFRVKPGTTGSATITVIVKDNGGTENGGADQTSRSFKVIADPIPVITGTAGNQKDVPVQITIVNGSSAELLVKANDAVKYEWGPSGSLDNSGIKSPVASPSQTTMYTVKVTNSYGDQVTVEYKVIVVELESIKIDPPNILSPDGDGVNDLWVIENINDIPNNEVTVFDKAGNVIYSKLNYTNDWDGTKNGSLLEENTYYYLIKTKAGSIVKRGFITIVRNY